MPLFSIGSSEQALNFTVRQTPVAPSAQELAARALTDDAPLPDVPSSDAIRLLIQSPCRLFSYWHYRADPFATLRKVFAQIAVDYQLTVRLVDVESRNEAWQLATARGTTWFDVQAARSYQAHFGLFAPNRPFIRLLSSNVVRTPRTSVSPVIDATPAFQSSPTEFAQVLGEAGYAPDAAGFAARDKDADKQAQEDAAKIFAQAFGEASTLTYEEQVEMLRLLSALISNADLSDAAFDELLANTTPRLAAWLRQLRLMIRDPVTAARLSRTLPLVLADPSLEQYLGKLATDIERWGASGSHQPPSPRALWMPSMTPGVSGVVRPKLSTD